ncbi:MAG: ABC transporter permease, partial [Clostridiales bacterium]|nr:ABC transporter permease [Clostridiales bacterium]
MKTFLKLCFSVIRKNKGFTAGLIIMSVLSVSIAFLGANFGASSDTTVMSYLSESGTPDAIFTTDMMPCSAADEILATDGVALVSPRLVFDTHMELDSGEPYSVRVLGFDKDAPFRQSVYESVKLNKEQNGVMLSRDFAEKNGIHAGDKITLSVSPGFLAKHDFTVEAVISNPETMNCVKDDISAYESSQFGYVYIDNDKLNEIIYSSVAGLIPFVSSEQMRSVLSDYAAQFSEEAGGQANQWLLYFDEGLPRDEEKAIMKNVEDVLGEHFISGSYTDESEALTSLRDDLGTISVLCSFIPCVIWLISLGFSFIFIKIIIENQRKTIGLLRALGYTAKKVVLIFVLYTVMINVIAALLGLPLGYGLLKLGLGAISSAEGIPEYKITLLWGTTALMTGVVFVIGIAASLFSSGAISKIDPSAAYGGSEAAPYEPPKFIANAKTDAFFKISLVSVFRNYKRQIIGALCISACVIPMCIGFEGVFTIG